ncbi:glycerophosphoryl diester phosphodiesterase [Paenibacillus castaneae]|uniref:glycerophosphodiester phosphodiesterase n=1 Tax=Paenibacillus castaneae TaxID=474957 RepID=UPI000C9A58E6|nr:glycerophosphodiester phosphodiesterase family protein [Paenibacillus castaneae]NIK78023.1 glycerophosphoryl diester phosphodiesterase [Paenibacillus castaneae]
MYGRERNFIWRSVGLLLLLLCVSAIMVTASNRSSSDGLIIIAHRGASGHAPENTMAAFEEAERLGAEFIEFDIQMSKDGKLVVIHDDTVDRTTNYKGNVDSYTLEELQEMDASSGSGSVSGSDAKEETLLSFQEVMDRFVGKMGMLVEIKDSPNYPGIEEKVAEIVRQYELQQDHTSFGEAGGLRSIEEFKNSTGLIIQSYSFESTHRIHTLLPNIPIVALIQEDQHPLSDETLDVLTSYVTYINYPHNLLDEEIIRKIHARNRKVMAWTIQTDQEWERVKKLGVDGVVTDYPG